MSRPVQEGGKDAANSVMGVLGLHHPDGSPLTLDQCRAWAGQARQEREQYRTALELVLKDGVAGDPIERAALMEGFWLNRLRYDAWRGLARLADFAMRIE